MIIVVILPIELLELVYKFFALASWKLAWKTKKPPKTKPKINPKREPNWGSGWILNLQRNSSVENSQENCTMCHHYTLTLSHNMEKNKLGSEFYFNSNRLGIKHYLIMISAFQLYVCPKLHRFLKYFFVATYSSCLEFNMVISTALWKTSRENFTCVVEHYWISHNARSTNRA